jgi:hypothetical protein
MAYQINVAHPVGVVQMVQEASQFLARGVDVTRLMIVICSGSTTGQSPKAPNDCGSGSLTVPQGIITGAV